MARDLGRHDLVVTVGQMDGLPVIRASGELDLSNVSEVRAVVAEQCELRPAALIFDLSDLLYMDSSGLGVLVGAKRRLAAHDGEVMIVTEQSAVLKALQLSGLDRIIRVFPDVETLRLQRTR
jgi:anti-sigma B factor antagonist